MPCSLEVLSLQPLKQYYIIITTLFNYVCMYGHTYSRSMDQPGKVASPPRGQLNRES